MTEHRHAVVHDDVRDAYIRIRHGAGYRHASGVHDDDFPAYVSLIGHIRKVEDGLFIDAEQREQAEHQYQAARNSEFFEDGGNQPFLGKDARKSHDGYKEYNGDKGKFFLNGQLLIPIGSKFFFCNFVKKIYIYLEYESHHENVYNQHDERNGNVDGGIFKEVYGILTLGDGFQNADGKERVGFDGESRKAHLCGDTYAENHEGGECVAFFISDVLAYSVQNGPRNKHGHDIGGKKKNGNESPGTSDNDFSAEEPVRDAFAQSYFFKVYDQNQHQKDEYSNIIAETSGNNLIHALIACQIQSNDRQETGPYEAYGYPGEQETYEDAKNVHSDRFERGNGRQVTKSEH